MARLVAFDPSVVDIVGTIGSRRTVSPICGDRMGVWSSEQRTRAGGNKAAFATRRLCVRNGLVGVETYQSH